MVLSQKWIGCLLQVGSEVLLQMEEFKYLRILFTSDGRIEQKSDRQIGAAVMQTLYQSVVVKRKLS